MIKRKNSSKSCNKILWSKNKSNLIYMYQHVCLSKTLLSDNKEEFMWITNLLIKSIIIKFMAMHTFNIWKYGLKQSIHSTFPWDVYWAMELGKIFIHINIESCAQPVSIIFVSVLIMFKKEDKKENLGDSSIHFLPPFTAVYVH